MRTPPARAFRSAPPRLYRQSPTRTSLLGGLAPATVSGYRPGGRRYAERLGAKTCLRADHLTDHRYPTCDVFDRARAPAIYGCYPALQTLSIPSSPLARLDRRQVASPLMAAFAPLCLQARRTQWCGIEIHSRLDDLCVDVQHDRTDGDLRPPEVERQDRIRRVLGRRKRGGTVDEKAEKVDVRR